MNISRRKSRFAKGIIAATVGLTIGGASIVPLQNNFVYAAQDTEVDYELVAKDFLQKALAQDFEGVFNMSSENFKSIVSKEYLATLFASIIPIKDEFATSIANETTTNTVHKIVSHTYQTSSGPLNVLVYFDHQGKIDDFNITQPTPKSAYQTPSYDVPSTYSEKSITFGKDAFLTSGTLTLPIGDGPFPIVILVHGSGPNDQDSSIYGLKPFRDIAVGLAKEGIATIRYEKRTKEHPIKSSSNTKFSLYEETVEDALLAVEYAKSLEEINTKEIFVLGHSQGGYALPKIIDGDKDNSVKGVISVSAPNQKFHELLVWQLEEQLERLQKSGASEEIIKQQGQIIDIQKLIFAEMHNPNYSKDNLPPQLDYWWYDLKDYVPGLVAKDQAKPMLILQGNKDIQVPGSHLESWKNDLANRDNIQYKLYPNMTHILFNFDGVPTGQEYALPNNVAPELIQDIALWVNTGAISPDSTVDTPVYWDNMIVKPGQTGRITVKKAINLWKRDNDKLVYVRTLKPNEVYRVYGFDNKFGGQYDLGVNHWVTKMDEHIAFEELPSTMK